MELIDLGIAFASAMISIVKPPDEHGCNQRNHYTKKETGNEDGRGYNKKFT